MSKVDKIKKCVHDALVEAIFLQFPEIDSFKVSMDQDYNDEEYYDILELEKLNGVDIRKICRYGIMIRDSMYTWEDDWDEDGVPIENLTSRVDISLDTLNEFCLVLEHMMSSFKDKNAQKLIKRKQVV
jgi:hypothetical protein